MADEVEKPKKLSAHVKKHAAWVVIALAIVQGFFSYLEASKAHDTASSVAVKTADDQVDNQSGYTVLVREVESLQRAIARLETEIDRANERIARLVGRLQTGKPVTEAVVADVKPAPMPTPAPLPQSPAAAHDYLQGNAK